MAIFGCQGKTDKWTIRATELINWLYDNKQELLQAGDNITLTPQPDGTVRIDAAGGGGDVSDVQMNGSSIVEDGIAAFNNYVEITQAEYDALPASKISDGILYCIKDGAIDPETTYAPEIYTTAEREIGTWLDGCPIYQKTIVYLDQQILANANDGNVLSLGISDMDIVVDSRVIMTNTAKSNYRVLNAHDFQGGDEKLYYAIYPNDGIMRLYANVDWSAPNIYITIKYTKSTDVPGSGMWGSLGAPSCHYSTQEHVVGTWIDGKPLFEKTLVYGGSSVFISMSSWNTLPLSGVPQDVDYFFHEMCTTDCSEGRIRFKWDNGVIKAAADMEMYINQMVLTIRYTKS